MNRCYEDTKAAVLSVVLVSADTSGRVDGGSAAVSLRWSAGKTGLKRSCASLLPLFHWFFVRSNSVKDGSNDADRVSDGHVAVIWPGDDGTSLIYTRSVHSHSLHCHTPTVPW